jgi:hypothetical protein
MTPADIIMLCTIFGIPAVIGCYATAAFILRRPHDLPDDLSDSYPGSLIGQPIDAFRDRGA